MNNLITNPNKLVVGIDPHKNSYRACILHPNEDKTVDVFTVKDYSLQDVETLIQKAHFYARFYNTKPIFVIESTNVFWRPLFSFLARIGLEVETVNSYQTKNMRKTLMRKTKTDTIDAKLIGDLYKQGKSHKTKFPIEPLFSLRELTRLYKFIADMKAMAFNRIHSYLFQIFPELFTVIKKTSKNALLGLIQQELIHPKSIAGTRIDKLANVLAQSSRGRLNRKEAELLKKAAQDSFGIPEGKVGFSWGLKILAQLYSQLQNMLDQLESEKIKPVLDIVPQKLLTLKGLGVVSAASFVAELGNPNNFNSAESVQAWFGLDPVIAQSGKKSGAGKRISKSGTKYGRESLYLAANTCILHNPKLLARYRKLKSNGRKAREAKVIIAADLAKICYAMMRDNSEFNPDKIV